MALKTNYQETSFGVGDKVRILQKIKEGDRERTATFEGIVIAIKNRGLNRTFTVRRAGEQGVGIEKIYPLFSPFIVEIKVLKKAAAGVRKAKLYYLRGKSPKEISELYAK